MTTATPLRNAVAAATRARILAELAQRRAPFNPARAALENIADALYVAANAFIEDEPQSLDGVVITNCIPWDAWEALNSAQDLAAEHPVTGFPLKLAQYVTQPVYRNELELPAPLNPRSPALAAQEERLRGCLEGLHQMLTPGADDDTVTVVLESAFSLLSRYGRLAGSVKVDHALPQSAHIPAPAPVRPTSPADAAPGPIDVTGLTPYTVGIIRLAESKGLRPQWGDPRGNARRIVLNAVGPHGAFGSIQVGRTSGKVLRAEIIPGNGGKPIQAKGTNAVRAALQALPAATCPDGCDAPSPAVCARTSRP
ncbi:hypothetical protein [Streptomyces sp. NPDC046685]|uniref:hypothetical protein n=1 Tax=Streptomyces sp. NPDC046685 TaxID=3157202 RepID=UPI00340D7ADD